VLAVGLVFGLGACGAKGNRLLPINQPRLQQPVTRPPDREAWGSDIGKVSA